ncbi:hypothetical protein TNCV_64841 [Trichonephila clavipes]|nr:hypothetical protein TNCV_64841 [Trichonephila clavipes]
MQPKFTISPNVRHAHRSQALRPQQQSQSVLEMSGVVPLLGGVPPPSTLCPLCWAPFGQGLYTRLRCANEVRKLFGRSCGELEPVP